MSFNSRNQGSKCVSMRWRAISARQGAYHVVAAQRLGAPAAAAAGVVDDEVGVLRLAGGDKCQLCHHGVHRGRPGDGNAYGALARGTYAVRPPLLQENEGQITRKHRRKRANAGRVLVHNTPPCLGCGGSGDEVAESGELGPPRRQVSGSETKEALGPHTRGFCTRPLFGST